MDGNGRWAQNRGLLRVEGHRAGVDAVKTVIRCCLQAQIPVLSLFAFSSENWARPENEVEFLMKLFIEALGHEVEELHQHGICLRFTGDRAGLSKELQKQMQAAEELTAANKRLVLNVVVNYGGKWDIVQATKNIAARVAAGELAIETINEELLNEALSCHGLPDPDLFIRTSGEQRISNFFLWQLAYTELYFTDIHWPDFTAEEFKKALTSFSQRERRYGKTSQQIHKAEHV
ncbi:undecaprenyl pyrophosphate synthetase [Legionella hackeliae]|nr:undecaprenyl pyrophosphate synthase [Legionella hackeliae]STX49604.1 undecaprenyl pyrophosphate synthetase [Legionella hackeliae]